jgi:broad specificity phosphatase PhoE
MMRSARTTRLYLIRHGETDWNREQRLQGTRDVPLNTVGAAQARRLAHVLGPIPIACIVTSPLKRASATAVILARGRACSIATDARLREIDHGTWSGRTLPDLGSRFPSLVEGGLFVRSAFEFSGGEPLLAVYRRASTALADVIERHGGQSVAMVGHGVTLAAVVCAATGLDIERLHEKLPPNAGGAVLTFTGRHLVDARISEPLSICGAAARSGVAGALGADPTNADRHAGAWSEAW